MSPNASLTGEEIERTIEENQARANIVATLVAGIAAGAGLDVTAATTAAQIETENNAEDFGLQFDESCRATNSCNGIRYEDYQTIKVGDLKPDGTEATQADVDFARRAYQRAFYSLALTGNAVTPTNVRIVLEAVIGGDLDDQRVSRFLSAYGGAEGVAAIVTSGRASATTLARQFIGLENLKRVAFEQTPLSEINRYANDPAAFRALSASNPQYATQIQLAFAYASENTSSAFFNGTGSVGDRFSLLNRELALGTRAIGLVQGVGSTIGALGAGTGASASGAACPATVGLGCAGAVALGLLTAVEADQALAGFRTFFSGNSTNSFLASGISGLTGINPNNADLVIGLGAGGAGIAVGVRTVANSTRVATAATAADDAAIVNRAALDAMSSANAQIVIPSATRVAEAARIADVFTETAPTIISNLRAGLTGSARTSGNVAVAEIAIPGIPNSLSASSRIVVEGRGVVGATPGILDFGRVPTAAGVNLWRNTDSEYQILNSIANRLGNNNQVAGRIVIVSERTPCSSCAGVTLNSFRQMFPNIIVEIRGLGTVVRPARTGG